ncbi:MAG: ThiF family adenylyltransferase [Anaerolineae bacterium]|nr:ThiF family adenylyltransferase [Anaerolineae bacterium]
MSWDRVEQLLGTDNLKRLAQKKVAIVGLGSGGGLVALHLAMSGVGHFVLVDDDVLEEGNIVRHVADRRYIGWHKVDAVADLIHHRNPHAQVEVRKGRIEQHADALDHIDILVSAVDGEGPKYVLNQFALDRNLPAVYAGVYERGEGGDSVVIYPYDGPCYACWAAELREEIAQAMGEAGQELDYGMIGPEGTLEAEPGLWLHVTRVATTQAQLVLNELLKGTDVYEPMPGNTVILANSALEIVSGQINQPQTAVWVTINRDPHCLVCGDKLRNRAELTGEQADISLDDLMDATGIVMQEKDED